MTLKEYITFHRPALEETLRSYLNEKKEECVDTPLYVESINKIMQTVVGGKLIRGILVLLAYESKKNMISKNAMKLAAAVELIHTGLLIHDDIMDNDHLRRGKLSVFAQAIQEGKDINADNPQEYGNAIATCIGDLSFFMAYELIGKIEDISQAMRILQTSSQELQKVGYAQITDIHFGINEVEPSEENIFTLYRFKTARYSFSLPLNIGGMLAGYDPTTLENFVLFGESLGIAYQIKDDELGIFGNEKTFGKPIGSDIRENKKTLIRHTLFSLVDESIRKKLKNIYGSKVLTKNDISLVKKYLRKYNVLPIIRKVREDKAHSAQKILDTLDLPYKYKLIFTDLVKFTNTRDK